MLMVLSLKRLKRPRIQKLLTNLVSIEAIQSQIKTNQTEWHNLETKKEKLITSLFSFRHQGQIKFEFLDLKGYKVG
jgi:hypothetical protein